MIDVKEFEQRVREADSAITEMIRERKVVKLSDAEKIKFIRFYRKQAELSLSAAVVLQAVSLSKTAKEFHKLEENYECFLWVINPSYYSMFYAAQALLAYKGIRLLVSQSIHKLTAHALIYYCVKNNFIAKEMYERFVQGQQDAAVLLNLEDFQEKAKVLSTKYFSEVGKRAKFTYETEEEVKQRHAQTSLERAKEFLSEVEQIID